MKKAGILVAMVGALLGCSDENAAEDKCNDLVKTFCSRVVTCAASDPALSAAYTEAELTDECEDVTKENAHCGDAFDVSDNYDSCLAQASNLECTESNAQLTESNLPIPEICADVILYSK
jgi:hypothetical protein